MHDPQYRMAIAWQNSAYNQPPHPGFYLGQDMDAPPVPNIYLAGEVKEPIPDKPEPLKIRLLSISPNPVFSIIRLYLTTENGHLNMTVSSLDGRTVFKAEGSLSNLNDQLNRSIGTFKRGVYYIKIIDEDKLYANLFIKL